MADRRRKLGFSPAGSSLGLIDEGINAQVPPLPPVLNFPSRAPSPSDVARIAEAIRPAPKAEAIQAEHRSASLSGAARSSSSIDVDSYAKASSVQKLALLKHKRPPTPPSPRSVQSGTSAKTKERLAALEAKLDASTARNEQLAAQQQQLAVDRDVAVEFAQSEQLRRLDAESRASSLHERLHCTAQEVGLERAGHAAQIQAVSAEAQQHMSLADVSAQQVSQHAASYAAQQTEWCAEQVNAARQQAKHDLERVQSSSTAAHASELAQLSEQLQQMQSKLLESESTRTRVAVSYTHLTLPTKRVV